MIKEIVLSVKKLKINYKVETSKNKYTFSEETIIKYSIFKGKEFSEDELDLILEEENKNFLMNKAINYLSYQARSVNEVRKYLLEKVCSNELAEIIIQKISSLGYLNDTSLADATLDYVIRTNKGPKALELKLIQKELDEDLIRTTVNKYSSIIEEGVLEDLIASILPKYKTYPTKKQKTLVYQKLLRDGFNSEAINKYINSAQFIDESDEELEKDLKKLINKYSDNLDYKVKSTIINKLLNKGYDYSRINECLNNLE